MPKKAKKDPAMVRALALFEKSGLTQQELGERMGYDAESARKSVWQFLKTDDPRVGMLRRFAQALDVPLTDLIQ